MLSTLNETSIIRMNNAGIYGWRYIYRVHFKMTLIRSFVRLLIQGGRNHGVSCFWDCAAKMHGRLNSSCTNTPINPPHLPAKSVDWAEWLSPLLLAAFNYIWSKRASTKNVRRRKTPYMWPRNGLQVFSACKTIPRRKFLGLKPLTRRGIQVT